MLKGAQKIQFLGKIVILASSFLLTIVTVSFSAGESEDEYLIKGIEKAAQDNFEEAKNNFENALKISSDPQANSFRDLLNIIEDVKNKKIKKTSAIYIFKGLDYTFKWEIDEAMVELDKAVLEEPDYIYCYLYRGNNYSTITLEYEKAIDDFSTALKIDPKRAYLYYVIAYNYVHLGRKEEAIAAFKSYIKHAPKEDTYLEEAKKEMEELERNK
jgi:tetratricopeptide (TPR) repeat protein